MMRSSQGERMESVGASGAHAFSTRTAQQTPLAARPAPRRGHADMATPTWKQSSATEHSMVARRRHCQYRLRSQLRAVAALYISGQSARAAYDPESSIRHCKDESVMAGRRSRLSVRASAGVRSSVEASRNAMACRPQRCLRSIGYALMGGWPTLRRSSRPPRRQARRAAVGDVWNSATLIFGSRSIAPQELSAVAAIIDTTATTILRRHSVFGNYTFDARSQWIGPELRRMWGRAGQRTATHARQLSRRHQSRGGGAALLASALSDTPCRIPPGHTEPIHLTHHHREVRHVRAAVENRRDSTYRVRRDLSGALLCRVTDDMRPLTGV
jgi:hypothetical protein